MKNQASTFFKQIFSILGSVLKSKTSAVKSKAGAIRTRLIVFGLLKDRVLFTTISHKIHASISHKIHALIDQVKGDKGEVGDQSKAIVVYNAMTADAPSAESCLELAEQTVIDECDDRDDDDYPDLTHSLFESEELEFENQCGSVIDMVKNSSNSADFNLEDQIDNIADLFIKRFHRKILMQKQQSFKRYQEMLNRSV